MRKILILILILLPLKLYACIIEIIVDVNGDPISNWDIEQHINLMNVLFGQQNMTQHERTRNILTQLIDEALIIHEAKRLNLTCSNDEINETNILYLSEHFKIHTHEVAQYIKTYNIDLEILKQQIKCHILWHKIITASIVPFIHISEQEIRNKKVQMENFVNLISFQEFFIPIQENLNISSIENNDVLTKLIDIHSLDSKIDMKITTVNINQLKGARKTLLEKLKVGEISAPIHYTKDYYSIIKIIDKAQLDSSLLRSTLKFKQLTLQNPYIALEHLKKFQINCSNIDHFTEYLQLPYIKEFAIKIRDLNHHLQMLFSKTNMNEIVPFTDNNTTKLMLFCELTEDHMTSYTEDIKQILYTQKILKQSHLLINDIRRNAVIHYHDNTIFTIPPDFN
ncbi:SurA N-terminal domain-containing protein [Wolbachia endosymbiont of Howardula sp.]|uniref:SurA N-terminal domain-containing protein n=1 Tax=Wolbachia endosymbiont of Howardula sp. TaxID=2916816 RepID=UPI00217E6CED|nr:SurA N-terminal domain-containing protein [Wolbachia endosymbiont of Howardula sp.]UWI83282.1 SurA N-terminal domain-containing protein [Wolbachia endosymbiont of Howardula sp.]